MKGRLSTSLLRIARESNKWPKVQNNSSSSSSGSDNNHLPWNPSFQRSILSTFHSSRIVEINSTMVGVGVGMVVVGVAGKYILDAIPSRHQSKIVIDEKETNSTNSNSSSASSQSQNTSSSGWMSDWFAKNFYDGGFEEKMTKREAALILGVRESASIERVKEAHRRVMILNHPDKGGSVYLTAKINEAKDLLLKGRTQS